MAETKNQKCMMSTWNFEATKSELRVFISHNFIFFSQNCEKRTQNFLFNFFNLLIFLFRSKHGLPCYIEDEAYNLHTIWQLLCVVLLLMRRVTKGGRKYHTYHVCEADVEEEAGGDGRNPLLDDALSGDGQCDVQADEGGERAALRSAAEPFSPTDHSATGSQNHLTKHKSNLSEMCLYDISLAKTRKSK